MNRLSEWSPGGVTNRLNERLGYNYDAAGNFQTRTNDLLRQHFGVNTLKQLSAVTTTNQNLMVAGMTTTNASSVVVNGNLPAVLYSDATWANQGFAAPNGIATYTAVATESNGRKGHEFDRGESTCDGFLYLRPEWEYDQRWAARV